MASIDDIIKAARLPEKGIPLCLRGDLRAEWEDLERELRVEQDSSTDESLAGNPRARDLSERMEAIAAQMREHEVTFRFRALDAKAYSDLVTEHRASEEKRDQAVDGLDWDTYPPALIAACAIDPKMTVEKAGRLKEAVTDRQWEMLVATALACNRQEVSVPFSLAASAIRAASEPRPKRPAHGASPGAGSSDESLAG